MLERFVLPVRSLKGQRRSADVERMKVGSGYAADLDVEVGRWLRMPKRIRGLVAAGVGYLLLMLGAALQLYLSDPPGGGDLAGAVVFAAVFGLPAVWAIWRSVTAGLMIGGGEIVIRGFLRTRRVPTASAVGFEPGVFGWVGNGNPGPMLKVDGGDPIGVWALAREGLVWNFDRYMQEAASICDVLNVALAAVTPAGVERCAPNQAPISSIR